MTFFFDEEKFPIRAWPHEFDNILDSDPYSVLDEPADVNRHSPRRRPKTRPEIKQFMGSSKGRKNGHMFGRVHALSNQHDIHGWQRVTIMKFFENDHGNFDPDQIWAYEGVVLPGGRMILGRWWNARADPIDRTTLSGPFIFWNVDERNPGAPADAENTMSFAKTIDRSWLTF